MRWTTLLYGRVIVGTEGTGVKRIYRNPQREAEYRIQVLDFLGDAGPRPIANAIDLVAFTFDVGTYMSYTTTKVKEDGSLMRPDVCLQWVSVQSNVPV